MQTVSELNTQSPINAISIDKQNEKLIKYLENGHTIHFIKARELGIGFLNSRISDLIKLDHVIYKQWVKINGCTCKEYSLTPFKKD